MKKTSFKVVGGLALLAASSMAMASVVNTKHNLGASHPSGVDGNHTNATREWIGTKKSTATFAQLTII